MSHVFKSITSKCLRNVKAPFLISWALTHRCNHRCLYCRIWKMRRRELSTKDTLFIINELASMGAMLICLSGGEPLLRNDIGKITSFICKKNMSFDISSNGYLVKKKISQIEGVRVLCLSLDGPEKLHDQIRGRKGAYKNVLEAAHAAKKRNISVYFRTVLSKMNLSEIDHILNIAAKLKIKVIFQPATQNLYGTDNKNSAAPFTKQYKGVIDKLIVEKERGNEYIHNSIALLKYNRRWPGVSRIKCISEKIFFHLEPDGMVYPCIWNRNLRALQGRDCLKLGIKEAIFTLPKASACKGCWDSAVCSLNFLLLDQSEIPHGNALSSDRAFLIEDNK